MKSSLKVTAVVLCAGMGERAKLGYNKILHPYGGCSVAARTVKKFERFDRIVVVCSPEDKETLKSLIDCEKAEYVYGGATRTESVRNALKAVVNTDIVIIHDGARPFVTKEIIDKSVASAIEYGSGIAAIKSVNAIKYFKDGKAVTLNRDDVFSVQTPQSFRFDEIKKAYDSVAGNFADDSEVYELAGFSPTLTEGSRDNVKLTEPADFFGLNDVYRIGFGFDVHRFEKCRDLILCGRKFNYEKGLLGHSDADAPVHAIMDALLSAAGMPDIGVLFPDNDPKYKDANSIKLLESVRESVCSRFEIVNVSVCIIAQKPKIAPYVSQMRQNLANALNIAAERVNISATTSELLGITGDGSGLAASADVLIKLI